MRKRVCNETFQLSLSSLDIESFTASIVCRSRNSGMTDSRNGDHKMDESELESSINSKKRKRDQDQDDQDDQDRDQVHGAANDTALPLPTAKRAKGEQEVTADREQAMDMSSDSSSVSPDSSATPSASSASSAPASSASASTEGSWQAEKEALQAEVARLKQQLASISAQPQPSSAPPAPSRPSLSTAVAQVRARAQTLTEDEKKRLSDARNIVFFQRLADNPTLWNKLTEFYQGHASGRKNHVLPVGVKLEQQLAHMENLLTCERLNNGRLSIEEAAALARRPQPVQQQRQPEQYLRARVNEFLLTAQWLSGSLLHSLADSRSPSTRSLHPWRSRHCHLHPPLLPRPLPWPWFVLPTRLLVTFRARTWRNSWPCISHRPSSTHVSGQLCSGLNPA